MLCASGVLNDLPPEMVLTWPRVLFSWGPLGVPDLSVQASIRPRPPLASPGAVLLRRTQVCQGEGSGRRREQDLGSALGVGGGRQGVPDGRASMT